MIIPIDQAAKRYGIKRKSIRQAARRHQLVADSIVERSDGEVCVDTDVFDAWWQEQRDARMDLVRQGIGS